MLSHRPGARSSILGVASARAVRLALVVGATAALPVSAEDAPDFGVPASLRVVLAPDASDAAAERWGTDASLAGWRLAGDGGTWMLSGNTVGGLVPGEHALEFAPIPGWYAPLIERVALRPGVEEVTALYRLAPRFTIGDVPPQTARHGGRLTFAVARPEDVRGGLWFEVLSGQPQGELSFDPATGDFVYEPTAGDRHDFTVTFGAGGASQDVTVSPHPELPPEESVIAYEFAVDDAESRAYLTVSIDEVPAPATPFNHDANLDALREVTISGKTVVFRPGHPNSLFERFAWTETSDIHDIARLVIHAETLVVGHALRLPQTDITVHARELRFEDGAEPASLSTTPLVLERPLGSSGRANGADGLAAGDITLHVRDVVAPGDTPRFILGGGRGQDPELGHDGAAGGDCASSGNMTYWHWEVWVQCIFGVRTPENDVYGGDSNCRPANGAPAVAAARPGAGGDAGLLRAPFDLSAIADTRAGIAGAQGGVYRGGRAGLPRTPTHGTRWITYECTSRTQYDIEANWRQTGLGYTTQPGSDAPSPPASNGNASTPETIESSGAWLHPFWVAAVVAHARDAYLRGNPDVARSLLGDYDEQLEDALVLGVAPEISGLEREFEQERADIESLLERIDSDLDYFGHPPGWVPMLSFEANLQAFRNEIDAGLRTLWLAYWLGNRADAIEDKTAALTEARAQSLARIQAMKTEYREVRESLPVLRAEWESVSARLETLEEELAELEARLIERASSQVEGRNRLSIFRRGTLILSGVLSLWPGVGKTVAGRSIEEIVGENDRPRDGSESNDDVGEFFSSSYEAGLDEFEGIIDLLDPAAGGGDPIAIGQEVLRRMVVEPTRKIHRGLSNSHAPLDEVEAELAAIRAYDPDFRAAVDQVLAVSREKALLATRVRQAVESLSRLIAEIQEAKMAVLATTEALDVLHGKLDHATFLALRKIERQAKDRLLWYQYLTAKSLEYRLVERYSDDPDSTLDLGRLFDGFAALGEVNPEDPTRGFELDADDFAALEAVYTQELSRITRRFFEELNSNAPERSVPIRFGLSSEELAALNRDGRIAINMAAKGIFGSTEESLRIIDLRTSALSVSPRGGAYRDTALLRISLAHSGVSTLRARGDAFRFVHYRDSDTNPLVWRTVFDGIDGSTTETTISAETESLLRALLDGVGGGGSDLILYSRPAADAEIVISKEVRTDNGVDMQIDQLRLEVEYGFYEKPSSRVELAVVAQTGAKPLFVVGTPDANGRRDGRGSFVRVFSRGQSVTIEAPARYGLAEFEGWADAAGEIVDTNPVQTVRLESSVTLRPVYAGVDAAAGPHFVRGDGNGDGRVDISDAQFALNFLFLGGGAPPCSAAADANADGRVDISDAQFTLNFLFLGGGAPPAPWPSCGGAATPTDETLGCDAASSTCA